METLECIYFYSSFKINRIIHCKTEICGLCAEGPRYTTQHITMKDPSVSGEKKSLDENGNAVQTYNGERKKPRRKHTQEHNVKVYNAENVEGHRNIEDINILINFIENKESKSKKGKTGNPVRVKTSSGTKPRTREKDTKREQLPSKLKKSNSLEEISKTKLEDLTTEKSVSSSGASSVSSQHGMINIHTKLLTRFICILILYCFYNDRRKYCIATSKAKKHWRCDG